MFDGDKRQLIMWLKIIATLATEKPTHTYVELKFCTDADFSGLRFMGWITITGGELFAFDFSLDGIATFA
jgi:hypothetical protein